MVDVGEWLIERRGELDRGEAGWLERLAEFDRDQLWAAEGHLSCVSWLVWRTNMGRSTAFDKQDRPPPDEAGRSRDVRIRRGDDGTGRVIVKLSDLEVEEFAAALQAFVDRRYRPRPGDQSSPEESATEVLRYRPHPVDESSPEDRAASEAPLEEPSRPAKTADAFMDLVHTALNHADGGQAAGDDRYLVHLVTRPDHPGMATLARRPSTPPTPPRSPATHPPSVVTAANR